MNRIDITKPVALSDGTILLNVQRYDSELFMANLPEGTSARLGSTGNDNGRLFEVVGGRHHYGDEKLGGPVRNVPAFDHTKPMALNDGTPVEFVRMGNDGKSIFVRITGTSSHPLGRIQRRFTLDGKRRPGSSTSHFFLINSEPTMNTIDWTKPLQRRDGVEAKLLATTTDNRRVVEVGDGFWNPKQTVIVDAFGRAPGSGRTTSGGTTVVSNNDIVNKVVVTTQFLNVYSNGNTGGTSHSTLQAAKDRSQVGKTRVGILEMTSENGTVVSTRYHACKPEARKSGYNPSSFVAQ